MLFSQNFIAPLIIFYLLGNHVFEFKQFTIHQDRCAMRFSTDAAILGAWADLGLSQKTLDIGTGTGILSLMLAQRFPETVFTAVEIDQASAGQAAENFAASPWKERLFCLYADLYDFTETADTKFDSIVCNPPYFENGQKPQNPGKAGAKHVGSLDFEGLLVCVGRLLSEKGVFWVVLPAQADARFAQLAAQAGLFPFRRLIVRDSMSKPPHRILTAFSFDKNLPLETSELCIKNADSSYSDAYSHLLKGYFLIF